MSQYCYWGDYARRCFLIVSWKMSNTIMLKSLVTTFIELVRHLPLYKKSLPFHIPFNPISWCELGLRMPSWLNWTMWNVLKMLKKRVKNKYLHSPNDAWAKNNEFCFSLFYFVCFVCTPTCFTYHYHHIHIDPIHETFCIRAISEGGLLNDDQRTSILHCDQIIFG